MDPLREAAESMRIRLRNLINDPQFKDTRNVLEIRLETLDELLVRNPAPKDN